MATATRIMRADFTTTDRRSAEAKNATPLHFRRRTRRSRAPGWHREGDPPTKVAK
jgi:hypothetical protein